MKQPFDMKNSNLMKLLKLGLVPEMKDQVNKAILIKDVFKTLVDCFHYMQTYEIVSFYEGFTISCKRITRYDVNENLLLANEINFGGKGLFTVKLKCNNISEIYVFVPIVTNASVTYSFAVQVKKHDMGKTSCYIFNEKFDVLIDETIEGNKNYIRTQKHTYERNEIRQSWNTIFICNPNCTRERHNTPIKVKHGSQIDNYGKYTPIYWYDKVLK